MSFYTDAEVDALKKQFGGWAYISRMMDRFVNGEFAILCFTPEQAGALLPAILDAADRKGLKPDREPAIAFSDCSTIYYVDKDGSLRHCNSLYVKNFPHLDTLNTIVSFGDLVLCRPFDDDSRELFKKLGLEEED